MFKTTIYAVLCFLFPLFGYADDIEAKEVFVEATNARLFCRVMGQGKPLIIIHGGPGLSQNYLLPQMSKLAENNLVIFYDQRGCGQSTGTFDTDTDLMKIFVADLDAVRTAFGCNKAAILGHSWGGFVAMEYAIAHPEAVDKLILSNSMSATSDDLALFLAEYNRRIAPFMNELKELMESPKLDAGDPDTFTHFLRICFKTYCYNPADAYKLSLDMPPHSYTSFNKIYAAVREDIFVKPFDLREKLKKLSIKALVVHGDTDPIPVSTAENIHKSIPNSKLTVINNCGHFPYVEKPNEYFGILNTFLSN